MLIGLVSEGCNFSQRIRATVSYLGNNHTSRQLGILCDKLTQLLVLGGQLRVFII